MIKSDRDIADTDCISLSTPSGSRPGVAAAAPPVASDARLETALADPARLAALAQQQLCEGAPEPIFDRFAGLAAHAAHVPVALVSLVDCEFAHLVGICGIPQPLADAREVPISHSFCKHVVANEAPMIIENAHADPVLSSNPALTDLGVVAYAGFPIVTVAGRTLGSLCAIDYEPRVWDQADLDALRDIAMLVANELERRSVVRRLSEEARTDALTGLANRRTWNEELPSAVRRAQRLGHSLSIALIDLDRFKAFNDRYGHPAGDQALRDVAGCWQREIRDIDVLARIGGEEFGLILPGCDAQTAVVVAGRLRAATPDSLTASAGVACWDAASSVEQLVASADRALYKAKGAGRDRVVLSAPPEHAGDVRCAPPAAGLIAQLRSR